MHQCHRADWMCFSLVKWFSLFAEILHLLLASWKGIAEFSAKLYCIVAIKTLPLQWGISGNYSSTWKVWPRRPGLGRELQSEEAAADVVSCRLLGKEENTSGQRATKVPMQIKISHGPANTPAKVKRINGEIKTREGAGDGVAIKHIVIIVLINNNNNSNASWLNSDLTWTDRRKDGWMDMQLWLSLTRAYFIIHSIGNFKLQCGGGVSSPPAVVQMQTIYIVIRRTLWAVLAAPLPLALVVLAFVILCQLLVLLLIWACKIQRVLCAVFIWTFNCCICSTAKLNRQMCGTTSRYPASS